MTLTEVAFNAHHRPVATVLELTASTLARLIGFRGADVFMEVVSEEEVKGMPFFSHYSGQSALDRYHGFMLGRVHVILSRGPVKAR